MHSAFAGSGGTTAAEFLRLGSGWPAGMSEAGASATRDSTALKWNPAGIGAFNSGEVYAAHASMPQTLSNDFISYAQSKESGRFQGVYGYSLQILRQGSLAKLDNAGATQGSYSAMDMAHTLGYAVKRGDLRVGGSLSYISQRIDKETGSSFALGLGAQKDLGAFRAGASLTHLGPGLKLGSKAAPLPTTLRAGGTYRLLKNDLILGSDVSHTTGLGARLHLGAAYRVYPPDAGDSVPMSGAFVRLGYTAGPKDASGPSGLAAGAGFYVNNVRADFTFQPFGRFGDVIQLGLGYKF